MTKSVIYLVSGYLDNKYLVESRYRYLIPDMKIPAEYLVNSRYSG